MIRIKNPQEIKEMRRLGKLASRIMRSLVKSTRPGISTKCIEDSARQLMDRFKVRSAFLGYKGFPGALCISLNEELIHGIPSEGRIVKDSDLVLTQPTVFLWDVRQKQRKTCLMSDDELFQKLSRP
jgi:methionyl aminopeptidase